MMTVSMATDRATSPTFGNSNPQERPPVSGSGFTPLPPIRRTSTFDLMTRKKLAGEEEENAPSPVGSSDNDIPPVPPMKEGPVYQNGNGQMPSQMPNGREPTHLNHQQPQNYMQQPPPQQQQQQQHPALVNGVAHAPNGYAPGKGVAQFNGIQQQMYMGRGGPPVSQGFPNVNNPNQPFTSQINGNPIQKFPPTGQWKLEESHLSEPLKNRPGASSSPPLQQQEQQQQQQRQQPGYDPYDKETEDSAPPNILRTRPRNNSNNIPPVSAERYRGLFAEQPLNFTPPQANHPALRNQPNEVIMQGGQWTHHSELNKEMEVHVDEIIDPSVPSEDQQRRRGSGIFSLNHRNKNPEPVLQHPDANQTAKEKSNFLNPSSLKNASTWDHDDNKPASMKKRLSELRGMIKGVGNAKDGAKEEQPPKPSTSYMHRPSLQGPMRANTGLPNQGHQPSPLSQPPVEVERVHTNEIRPPGHQHTHSEDEHKKHGGGFLGGLFNKQGAKPSVDSRQQPNQQVPPAVQRPMGPQGQGQGQGQPYGPHPRYVSAQLPNGLQPGQQPGQQGVLRPMLPNQVSPQENIQSPTSPHLLGTAQAVMMRRPSEITVSSQSPASGALMSPPIPGSLNAPLQRPQTNVRLPTGENPATPKKQFGGEGDYTVSGALPKNSPRPSHEITQDVNGSPSSNRTTPSRKPVGSGFAGQTGTPSKLNDSELPPTSPEDERRLSSQLPSGQQSPTLGKLGHVRQTSLPSPGRPPIPAQPGQVTFSPAVGGAQSSMSSQPQGVPRARPNQGPGPQQDPRHPQDWRPIGTFSNQQQLGPPNQNPQGQQPQRLQGGSPPNAEQQNAILSKFLPGKNNGQAQGPKEKSAASKFLNAFKRGSKQSDQNQTHEQQRPPPGRQTPPHMIQQRPGPQPGVTRPSISGPSPAGPLGPMSNFPQGVMQPGQGRGQMQPPQRPMGHDPLPPAAMYGGGRGPVPLHMQTGGSQKPHQILGIQPPIANHRSSTQRLEPQYDHVPIPRGYEAVHGYGNAGTLAPSPYNVGRPSPPPAAQPQQFQFVPQGVPPQQWDPRMVQGQQPPVGPGPYGRPPLQVAPSQQSISQPIPRQPESEATTPTPSEQGTFLDMAPTPPLRQSHEDLRLERQPTRDLPQNMPQQTLRHQPSQQHLVSPPHSQGPDSHTPSSSNWGSAPDSGRSPPAQGKQIHNPLALAGPAIHSKPSDPNISPPSDSGGDAQPRTQPQHIATAMSNNPPPPPQLIAPPGPVPNANANTNSPHPFSPKNPPARGLPGVPNTTTNNNNSPPIVQAPVEERPGSAAAGRLVSKMAVTNETSPKNTSSSLSPETIMTNRDRERATSVSPEPPGSRPALPYHQVSSNSLNINVDRANDIKTNKDEDEDIYDATPRMNSSPHVQTQTPTREDVHDNTKYAGSERGRPLVNGVGALGIAGATGGVVMMGADGVTPDVDSEASTPHLQRQLPMNMEPEEKILVDEPVELAAVNDIDDGIPAMSATSYPGQEWNPYAAGEFGDFD